MAGNLSGLQDEKQRELQKIRKMRPTLFYFGHIPVDGVDFIKEYLLTLALLLAAGWLGKVIDRALTRGCYRLQKWLQNNRRKNK